MKISLLLPDGIGVKNFYYSDFVNKCQENNIQVVAWAEPNILALLNGQTEQVALSEKDSLNFFGEFCRTAWQKGMLRYQARKFNDNVYLSYNNTKKKKNIKSRVKNLLHAAIVPYFSKNRKRLNYIRSLYLKAALKSELFHISVEQL